MCLYFKKKAYCQTCGRDLTHEGGIVSSDGKIYCITGKRSCFKSAFTEGNSPLDYKTPKEVQEDIKKEKLTHFGKLERTARNN